MLPVECERELKKRTKAYALRIIRLYSSLQKDAVAQVLGRQMLRSGTSVGAHYREACRGRSVAEFVSKMEGGLQELDETAYLAGAIDRYEGRLSQATCTAHGRDGNIARDFRRQC